MGRFVKAAKSSEVPAGSCKLIELEGNSIALFNLRGDYYAIDDICPHEGGPLHEGPIDGDEVECPWHDSRFNIKTGKCTQAPAEEDVHSYNVRVEGDNIEIEI